MILASLIMLLCPVTVYPTDSYFDAVEENWILEIPRSEIRFNRDCRVLEGTFV
jgi:hypothetical protein